MRGMTDTTAVWQHLPHPVLRRTVLWSFFALASLTTLTVILNVMIGSVWISPNTVVQVLLRPHHDLTLASIVCTIRLPRALAAAFGGAYLGVSGLILQVYFRNPIVGPFVLGISSGATLTVSVVMLTGIITGMGIISPFVTTIAGFVGAYGIASVVVAMAMRVRSGVTLLIIGLMVGYLCSSLSGILTALAEKERVKGFVLWEMGSFSGFKWAEILTMICGGVPLTALAFLLGKPLNAFLLGEEYALSMGVVLRRSRTLMLLTACALAGMVTAFAGPIAFVGLAVPHMARLIFKTADNHVLIPSSCLIGAGVTSLCDLVARMILSPVELPISAITSIVGAPIVIGLLLKRRTLL